MGLLSLATAAYRFPMLGGRAQMVSRAGGVEVGGASSRAGLTLWVGGGREGRRKGGEEGEIVFSFGRMDEIFVPPGRFAKM